MEEAKTEVVERQVPLAMEAVEYQQAEAYVEDVEVLANLVGIPSAVGP